MTNQIINISETEDNRVVIEQMDDELYHIYDESGGMVEPDFESYEEAYYWAIDNGYTVVEYFNR